MRYAMIMAGGSGTRLWPVSRKDRPKQLAPLIGGRSLLDLAIERAHAVAGPERTLICAAAAYAEEIAGAAPSTPRDFVLGEPMGRDTLSAIGFAAAVLAQRDPEAVFCVLTADHLIEPIDHFAKCLARGFELAEARANRLVTFAIRPTFAATGYGYIQKGDAIDGGKPPAHTIAGYVEKPDLETAKKYLASGEYGWNSGMFVWRAATYLEAVKKFQPQAYDGLMDIARDWESDRRRETLERVYRKLPKISVDFAILEPAAQAGSGFELCAVDMDLTWSDVGSWLSYADVIKADACGMRASDQGGGVTALDVKDSLIVNHDAAHHVAVLGVTGLVVVHTPDATLVMPASESQRLKELHARLPERLQ